MLIVRVASGVSRHFAARAAEWALAAVIFLWGWVLLLPHATFDLPAYHIMRAMAPETVWGFACVLIGVVRLGALVVNGTFANTAYSRWSPHVRMGMSFLSVFFWYSVTMTFLTGSSPPGTGLAVYPVLLALEIYCTFRAARDSRNSDDAARHGQPR